MICFGAKTDQEVKENVTCRSHTNKKKRRREEVDGQRAAECLIFFYFFYFLSFLFSIYGNRTDGIRRGKNEKALLDEGYTWEPKTWDFAEFSIKNSENHMFLFFSDLRLSDGQN